MTRFKKLTIGISAAALAIGGVAYAQSADRPKMDADGDGVITKVEAAKAADAMFARMDANNDGKIDQADQQARHEEHRAEMFAQLDTNKDGSISKQEFTTFKGPGADGKGPGMRGPGGPGGMGPGGMGPDGMNNGKGPGKHHGEGRGDGHGMRGGRHGGGMMMLKMADTNNDGSITKAEFEATSAKHFAEMDTNKDGKVTKEERQAAHAKMKSERPARKGPPSAPPSGGAN